jgi:menaquinone-dependent protoporphyrinogen oxidase
MRTAIVYATTEGQTRKLARFCAERVRERGQEVEVIDAAEVPPDFSLDPYGLAIVMGSLHLGDYQTSLVDFVRHHRKALEATENAFVSVSLAAASNEPEDREGLTDCDRAFYAATGWTPKQVHHAAGAFRFTRYNFFKRWAMRMIAMQRGVRADTSQDIEYTDWAALAAFIDGLLKSAFRHHHDAA